jgi:hypothetical protein
MARGYLRLGLEGHGSRHTRLLPTLRVVGPRLWQVQSYGHRPRGLAIGIAAGHRHLAVAPCAQRPRILPRDPDLGRALLGKAHMVDHEHPIALRGLGDHLLHPLPVAILLIPRHIREELLELLRTGAWRGLGDGVAILSGQLGEQPRHLTLQRLPAFRPPNADLERSQTRVQLRQPRRTGRYVHRYPPFTIEDTTAHRILSE